MDHRPRHTLELARWLLPWIGALTLSSVVASAATGGLRSVLVEPPPVPTPASGDDALIMLSPVQIEITDHDGKAVRRLTCVAYIEGRSSPTIQISDNHFDVDLYLKRLCVTPAQMVPAQQRDPP